VKKQGKKGPLSAVLNEKSAASTPKPAPKPRFGPNDPALDARQEATGDRTKGSAELPVDQSLNSNAIVTEN
jgi:hypothetical protein